MEKIQVKNKTLLIITLVIILVTIGLSFFTEKNIK